jgi:transposase-like protein
MVTPLKDRNAPRRGSASESQYSLIEFMRDFPDDAACLDWLWRTRFSPDGEHADCPRCGVSRKFRRYKTTQQRQSWTCTTCGHHIHPTAGTIFQQSSTSLHLWFYGVYLMTSTRCGISAKQLERETGVTYKTAWRMYHRIRALLADNVTDFTGVVEVDTTWIGGKPRVKYSSHSQRVLAGFEKKTSVFGIVERGGKVRAIVNPVHPLSANVREHVLEKTIVYTDEAPAFRRLGNYGYQHSRVHHKRKVYVDGDVSTNTIEGFWSLVKRGISGVYHSVSEKYLQMYLDEYAFRYNNRAATGLGVAGAFLARIAKDRPAASAQPG